jgi:hypothetical protein
VDQFRRDFAKRHQHKPAQFDPWMGQDEGGAVQHPVPPEEQIQIQRAGRAGSSGNTSRLSLNFLQQRQRGEGIRPCLRQRTDRVQIVGLILTGDGAIRIPGAGLVDSGQASDPPLPRQSAETEAEMRFAIPQIGSEGNPDFRIGVGR